MQKSPLIQRGHPLPLGASLYPEGTNFALFSRHAREVCLIVEATAPGWMENIRQEFILDPVENRTGDIWHILIGGRFTDFSYGFRIAGPETGQKGLCYDADTILVDPYSHLLSPRRWGEEATYGQTPCCRLGDHDFDWENDKPLKRQLSDLVIYELHVRGFTRHPSAKVSSPGTFRGIIEKIPYLQELGITAVELMPVTEFDENDTVFHDPETGEKHRNFWGYNPVSFFAVKSAYSSRPEQTLQEFREMVCALHKAGIEVYLDMVYNHTGEGGYAGTTSSFRGIDNTIYYLLNEQGEYHNFSGCGNTTNCNHPVMRDLIRDSLRYWVTEMHIDGFRFDLASILGRDQQGNVLANPPMIEIIGQDPLLRDTKLIAEAWDAAGLYQVGSFSRDARWGEWNGKFRDDVRSFMTGADDSVARLATRIAGSSDLYDHSDRTPLCSINFITSHDGFTLYDLVSYDRKNNLANGENNRDGDNHNISWNSGFEGPGAPSPIEQLRFRRIRTFAVILLLSQGIPMFPAGDEFGRTQKGNNNAWCQDNETSWINWALLSRNRSLFEFFKKCIALRKQYPVFRRDEFFTNSPGTLPEIDWQYLTPGEQNWNHDCHALGFHLRTVDNSRDSAEFFVMISGERTKTIQFTPPETSAGFTAWHKIIDTGQGPPADILDFKATKKIRAARLSLKPFGCIVLQSNGLGRGRLRS